MKQWMLAVGAVGWLGTSSARADEVEAPRPAAHNWSVGLGVGYSWLPTDGLILQTAQGSAAFNPFNASSLLTLLTFTAERRVAPTTFLTAALQGGYLSGGTTASSSSFKYIAVGVGVRQVFNPGDVVEVSGFATLGFTDVQSGPAVVGIKLGPCVEYPFNDHLRLRFSATVIEGSYEKEGDSSVTGVFLTLQPNLALQVAF